MEWLWGIEKMLSCGVWLRVTAKKLDSHQSRIIKNARSAEKQFQQKDFFPFIASSGLIMVASLDSQNMILFIKTGTELLDHSALMNVSQNLILKDTQKYYLHRIPI